MLRTALAKTTNKTMATSEIVMNTDTADRYVVEVSSQGRECPSTLLAPLFLGIGVAISRATQLDTITLPAATVSWT